MAIPIAGILSAIPWDTVIRNAPMVAEKARLLWKNVGKKDDPETPDPVSDEPVQTIEVLQQRIIALEASNRDLHTQVTGLSDLIVQLSEQNASLVARVEINRTLLLRCLVASFAALLFALYLIFFRT